MIYSSPALPELKADKPRRLFFTYIGEDSSRDAKILWRHVPLLFSFLWFLILTFYAGIGGINKVLGFLIMLVFQSRMSGISFVVNARSSLAICRAIQSQSCLLLKQFWRRYCNWDFGKQFWIFLCGCSQRAVDNFNFRTEDLLTDLFTVKEDFGWGITTVTTKEI